MHAGTLLAGTLLRSKKHYPLCPATGCAHGGAQHLATTPMASLAAHTQANFLWAYATLGKRVGTTCMEALAAQAHKELPRANAQDLENMMWAFAKFNHSPDASLLQSCEAHATRIARAFTPQGVVRCCPFTIKR